MWCVCVCVQVELFYAVVNLYWGVWGFNQARDEGCAEFPYLLAISRLFGSYASLLRHPILTRHGISTAGTCSMP